MVRGADSDGLLLFCTAHFSQRAQETGVLTAGKLTIMTARAEPRHVEMGRASPPPQVVAPRADQSC